jgi:hypothetical protein
MKSRCDRVDKNIFYNEKSCRKEENRGIKKKECCESTPSLNRYKLKLVA